MRGWIKNAPAHYSRRVIYQLPMSDVSPSQNNKGRGQRRFCDDGSEQKRSAAERKRERERSDRRVDGGSGYKESDLRLMQQLTNHGSSWESEWDAGVYYSGRSVDGGPAGWQHQGGIGKERQQCDPGEQETNTLAHKGNKER